MAILATVIAIATLIIVVAAPVVESLPATTARIASDEIDVLALTYPPQVDRAHADRILRRSRLTERVNAGLDKVRAAAISKQIPSIGRHVDVVDAVSAITSEQAKGAVTYHKRRPTSYNPDWRGFEPDIHAALADAGWWGQWTSVEEAEDEDLRRLARLTLAERVTAVASAVREPVPLWLQLELAARPKSEVVARIVAYYQGRSRRDATLDATRKI